MEGDSVVVVVVFVVIELDVLQLLSPAKIAGLLLTNMLAKPSKKLLQSVLAR